MTEHAPIESQAYAAIAGDRTSTLPAGRQPAAIADSIAFADDRLDRTANSLNELEAMLDRLTDRLGPVLTDGRPEQYPEAVGPTSPGSPEDRRSTIAKRVADLGARADSQADRTQSVTRRIAAILDNLEV